MFLWFKRSPAVFGKINPGLFGGQAIFHFFLPIEFILIWFGLEQI